MSFRTRLGLFFLLMVAIPIAAIAVLASDVTGDSQAGKADAQVSTGLEAAISIYEDEVAAARTRGAALLDDLRSWRAFGVGAPRRSSAPRRRGRGERPRIPGDDDARRDELEPIPSDSPVATVSGDDADGRELARRLDDRRRGVPGQGRGADRPDASPSFRRAGSAVAPAASRRSSCRRQGRRRTRRSRARRRARRRRRSGMRRR